MNDTTMLLKSTGLGAGLSEEQLATLSAVAEEQEITKGTIIIKEESRTRDLYIIRKGRVSVRMKLPSGVEQEEILLMLTEGQIFGEFSLVDGSPRSATIRAEEDVRHKHKERKRGQKEAIQRLVHGVGHVHDVKVVDQQS